METAVTLLCTLERFKDLVGLMKVSLLDGLVDADDVLPDDATSTDVEMSEAFGHAISNSEHYEK